MIFSLSYCDLIGNKWNCFGFFFLLKCVCLWPQLVSDSFLVLSQPMRTFRYIFLLIGSKLWQSSYVDVSCLPGLNYDMCLEESKAGKRLKFLLLCHFSVLIGCTNLSKQCIYSVLPAVILLKYQKSQAVIFFKDIWHPQLYGL